LECVENTSTLVLHMKDIEIYNSTLSLSSGTDKNFANITNFSWSYDPITDFFIAQFTDNIFKANNIYIFKAEYKGLSQNDNIGIYKSSYIDNDKNKRYLIFF
jgi:hypothetical protein